MTPITRPHQPEDDLVRRPGLPIGQRPAQCGMETERRRHDRGVGVRDLGFHMQRRAFDPVGDVEAKLERIVPSRRFARFETPGAGCVVGLDQCEERAARKSVSADLVGLAGKREPVALHLTHDGK